LLESLSAEYAIFDRAAVPAQAHADAGLFTLAEAEGRPLPSLSSICFFP